MSCLSSLVYVHQKPARLFRLQRIGLLLYVQIPGKMLIVRTALKWMFPLFSVNTGVDETKDQSQKVCKLPPVRVPAWAYCKMETFATSHAAPWMGFLLVRSVYLWDPAIDGASQTGLPKPLLAAAAFTSTSELQPGLPS